MKPSLLSALLPPGCYRYWRKILFSHKKYGPVTVIVWWAENNEEPIYLITNVKSPKWVKIIHRTDRCDLSLFQLGLRLLEHFLDYSISIPVTFQLFNPLE